MQTSETIDPVAEARLKELLNSGASLEQLLAAMVPESRMDNLRRLALLRRFDRQAMTEALSLKDTKLEKELQALLEDNQVVESAEEPGIFAVASTHRQSARGWWNIVVDPLDGTWLGKSEDDQKRNKECHEIHERMVAYFSRAKGENWLYEHLHHLCAVKPGEAMTLLVGELATCLPQPEPDGDDAIPSSHPDARDGIALGRATDLLRLVEEQAGYLPAAEKDIYLAQSSLVETWTAVCRAWFRSRRYIQRPNVHQWFEEMRNPDGKPFLFLHAAGGSGKTMSLRWLITHHCVPRGEPVAHLDFDDFVDTGLIKGWQLLLRCAEQLDQQLPTRPLSTLIKDIIPFEQALRDHSRTPITRPEGMTEQTQPNDVLLGFPANFGRHLQRINDRIITIIIDTLEVPMLRDDVTDVTEFIAMLVRFAMVAPNVRIILCGRYQLADLKLEDELRNDGEIWNFYNSHIRRERLPRFDLDQTRSYLAAQKLVLSEPQIKKLFANGSEPVVPGEPEGPRECSPFFLSLFAATADGKSTKEVNELIANPAQLQAVYLMERVIARVDDVALRWVIRYGVVPRVLTEEFYKKVIVEQLLKVHNGESEMDRPGADKLPKRLLEKRLFFESKKLLGNEDAAAALWGKLATFASQDSWITPTSTGGFLFRAEVREPMTELIRESEVLREIHRKAAIFFEKAGDLRQEYYHLRQWNPQEASAKLEARAGTLLAEEKFEDVLLITDDLITPNSRKKPDFSSQVAELRVLAAIDMADISQFSGREQWIAKAEDALRIVALFSKESQLAARRKKLLDAMVAMRKAPTSKREEFLTDLKSSKTSDESFRQRIDRSIAMILEAKRSRGCIVAYASLLRGRSEAGLPPESRLSVFIARCLAVSVHLFGGDPDALVVLQEYKAALAETRKSTGENDFRELLASFASLLESYSRPGGAAALISSYFSPVPLGTNLFACFTCTTGRNFPDQGYEAYRLLEESLENSPDVNLRCHAIIGQAWTLTGMGDLDAAGDSLRRALELSGREAPGLAPNLHVLLAEHHLQTGNFTAGRAALRDFERSGKNSRSITREQRAALLGHEIGHHLEGTEITSESARKLLNEARASEFWYDRLRVAMSLLHLLDEKLLKTLAKEIALLLITTHKALPDAIARIRFIELIRERKAPLPFPAKLKQQLIELAALDESSPDLLGNPTDPADFAWAAVTRARWLWLLGEEEKARGLVSAAICRFLTLGSAAGLREAYFLSSLADWPEVDPGADEATEVFAKAPIFLRLMFQIEQGELCFRNGRHAEAEAWFRKLSFDELAEQESNWNARAFVLGADLSKGTKLEKTEYFYLAQAELHYTRLGDIKAAWQLRDRIQALNESEIKNATAAANDPGLPPVREAIEISGSAEDIERLFAPLGGEFSPADAYDFRQSASGHWVEMIANRPEYFVETMFGTIAKSLASDLKGKKQGRDLRLALGTDGLGSLPWELCRFNREACRSLDIGLIYRTVNQAERARVRWAQLAVNRLGLGAKKSAKLKVDGILGPLTRKAVAALDWLAKKTVTEEIYQLPEAVRLMGSKLPLRAVILQSGSSEQQRSKRGLDVSGSRLADAYQKAGVDCQVIRGVSLDELPGHWSEESPPDIVHIYASYFMSNGLVTPDFGRGAMASRRGMAVSQSNYPSPSLPTSASTGRRSAVRRWNFGPSLVILDGPAEPELGEHVRQIFLRNAYGEALAARGNIPNIFGLGLEAYPDLGRYIDFLQGIRRMASPRELYMDFAGAARKSASITAEQLHRYSGTLAPVLWTADPDLTVVI